MKTALILIPAVALGLGACRSASTGATSTPPPDATTSATARTTGAQANALPKTLVYKTNGDYNDNVPVTLNPEGTEIVSWPDPTDIRATSSPIRLAGGWLLDRRGITPTSAFLNYTYKEYSRLASCPSREELMKHIIPGSCVTEIRELPIRQWQAVDDPVGASKLVENAPTIFHRN